MKYMKKFMALLAALTLALTHGRPSVCRNDNAKNIYNHNQ